MSRTARNLPSNHLTSCEAGSHGLSVEVRSPQYPFLDQIHHAVVSVVQLCFAFSRAVFHDSNPRLRNVRVVHAIVQRRQFLCWDPTVTVTAVQQAIEPYKPDIPANRLFEGSILMPFDPIVSMSATQPVARPQVRTAEEFGDFRVVGYS